MKYKVNFETPSFDDVEEKISMKLLKKDDFIKVKVEKKS